MQKATPIFPPDLEENVVEVDMTKLYVTVSVLAVASVGLTVSNVLLWRQTRRNKQYLEAMAELSNRLVNDTDCGSKAYALIIEGALEEDKQDPTDEGVHGEQP
jgi:hypothetical protein